MATTVELPLYVLALFDFNVTTRFTRAYMILVSTVAPKAILAKSRGVESEHAPPLLIDDVTIGEVTEVPGWRMLSLCSLPFSLDSLVFRGDAVNVDGAMFRSPCRGRSTRRPLIDNTGCRSLIAVTITGTANSEYPKRRRFWSFIFDVGRLRLRVLFLPAANCRAVVNNMRMMDNGIINPKSEQMEIEPNKWNSIRTNGNRTEQMEIEPNKWKSIRTNGNRSEQIQIGPN